MSRLNLLGGAVFCVLLCFSVSADAALTTFVLNMSGAQEVGTPGDPDGVATGFMTLDSVANTVVWNFNYANIAAPTAMHIHTGAAGANGPVLVNLGVATTGDPLSTLIGSTSTSPANIAAINLNPTNFYVNIHNAVIPSGAIRGQITAIPEPSSIAVLAIGGAAIAYRIRRRKTA